MKKTALLLAVSLLGMLVACKEKSDPVAAEQFNINNPVGYYIYARMAKADGTEPKKGIFEFGSGNILRYFSVEYPIGKPREFTYAIVGENTIELEGDPNLRITITNDAVTSTLPDFKELALIKRTEKNELTGKTFSGTYYRANNNVLHQDFFYSFSESEVGAGFKTGTVTRTGPYTLIGGFAAMARVPGGSEDTEFMALINGKLEVDYLSGDKKVRQHATLTLQK